MKICVTGHRPDKLYGYDLKDYRWVALKDTFKELLKNEKCSEAITGMALGVDTVFALAVLELKKENYPIRLVCAVPCKNYSGKWYKKDRDRYDKILKEADEVCVVSDSLYQPYLMQKRNIFMVDRADKVLAVWNGENGGTANCVRYADKAGKDVLNIWEKLKIW